MALPGGGSRGRGFRLNTRIIFSVGSHWFLNRIRSFCWKEILSGLAMWSTTNSIETKWIVFFESSDFWNRNKTANKKLILLNAAAAAGSESRSQLGIFRNEQGVGDFFQKKIISVDELAAVSGKMAINCRSLQVAVVERK